MSVPGDPGLPFEFAVFRAAEAATEATSTEDIILAIEGACTLVGLPYFSIVEAVPDDGRFFIRLILGKTQDAWDRFYWGNHLYRQDLRLRHAARAPGPFFCSEVLRDEAGVTPEERRVFERAAEFGIRESYVLPHRGVDRRLFAAVLSGEGAPIVPRLRVAASLLSANLLLAACRLEAASIAAATPAAPPRLRPRQLECLEWARRGKSSADTAGILGLSPRTVDEHIASACKALDVRTRVQAVSKALAEGLLPYGSA